MMKRCTLAIFMLATIGCVQFPSDSKKVDTRTETSKVQRPPEIRCEQVNDRNAHKMAQALWDEMEADR